MFAIIGIVVVFGAIAAGYLMEHGNLLVLMQPAELIIILGAALGTILIANPLPTIIRIGKGVVAVFLPSMFSKDFYLEHLKLLNELFHHARKHGAAKLEADVEEPEKSPVFSKYPRFLKNHHAVQFVCDTLRMYITGGVGSFELDQMMELDMDVHHLDADAPVAALTTVADSLPGLGIVAAVLGVVITMGAIGGPPEEVGRKVAAALVGTFLGILLCYGLFGLRRFRHCDDGPVHCALASEHQPKNTESCVGLLQRSVRSWQTHGHQHGRCRRFRDGQQRRHGQAQRETGAGHEANAQI
jgi:chemotaxis protein MotA